MSSKVKMDNVFMFTAEKTNFDPSKPPSSFLCPDSLWGRTKASN